MAAARISKGEPAIPTIILEETGGEVDNPYAKGPAPTNI